MNEEAGRLLLEAYDDYAKHARLMTSIHAMPRDAAAAAGAAGASAGAGPKKAAADAKAKKRGLKRL